MTPARTNLQIFNKFGLCSLKRGTVSKTWWLMNVSLPGCQPIILYHHLIFFPSYITNSEYRRMKFCFNNNNNNICERGFCGYTMYSFLREWWWPWKGPTHARRLDKFVLIVFRINLQIKNEWINLTVDLHCVKMLFTCIYSTIQANTTTHKPIRIDYYIS